jgi:large subunit ribosomal protein L10
MSKPIKNLIAAAYTKQFGSLEGAVLVDVRGLKSNQNNRLRAGLAEKKIKVTVVKNSLAKRALTGSKLADLGKLLEGPSALVYGGESVVSVARRLMELAKEVPNLTFKGALMDGVIYGSDQIEMLSKLPTKAEAQGQVVTLIFSPAKKLAGAILSPGRKLASLIKAIQEKKEKEAPAAAPAA